MGRTAQENFSRRFGNPPRITVRFVNIEDEPDTDYIYQRIFEAWVCCCKALLGREPSEDEIFGRVSLEAVINEERLKGTYRGCLNNAVEVKVGDKLRPGGHNCEGATHYRCGDAVHISKSEVEN